MPQIREFSANLKVSEKTLEKESRAQGLLPQPGEHGRSTVLGVISSSFTADPQRDLKSPWGPLEVLFQVSSSSVT